MKLKLKSEGKRYQKHDIRNNFHIFMPRLGNSTKKILKGIICVHEMDTSIPRTFHFVCPIEREIGQK
jgi:hypothetical protein